MAQAPTPPSLPKKPAPRKSAVPKRAFGRSLSDFPNLSDAEKKLVACCAQGEICELGNGKLPKAATAANTIRAELIRFLALGGDADHPVHEEGVMLWGGWIKGILSLHQAQAAVRLDLKYCQFDAVPVFSAASLPELALSGSSVPGLNADRLTVAGGVFLRDGFAASGEVRLVGAQIGGVLSCVSGNFTNPGGNALSADRITVAGSVFLSDAFAATGEVRLLGAQIGSVLSCVGGSFTNSGGNALSADGMTVTGDVFLRGGFAAIGKVRLLGAQIGGTLSCIGGNFTNPDGNALDANGVAVAGSVFLRDGFAATGEVRLLGAQIGGSLECIGGSFTNEGGTALNAEGMVVTDGLFLRGATIKGAVNLTTAKIGTLVDDVDCWQAGEHFLDGLRYDRIIGPTDAKMRIKWLGQQRNNHLTADFRPQPWEQLITVLRAMGHPDAAAEVAIAKESRLRAARPWTFSNVVHGGLTWVYGLLAGYGYRPIRIFYWMIIVCMVCSLFYYTGRETGHFGPTSPLIYANSAFDMCGAPGETDAKGKAKPFWTSPACPTPPEYTTFQPFLYSLDLILPFVDLHQESDWAPLVVNPAGETLWWGRVLRWMMWFEILFGWAAGLRIVAVLGKLVDKD